MAGYIGSKIAVTQVDGYNRTEADAEFVNDPNAVINVSGSNVGIGTSSPAQKLDVSGSIAVSDTTTSTKRLQLDSGASSHTINSANYGSDMMDLNIQAENLKFNTGLIGVAERMRIDSSGNLLVGTTDINPVNNSDGTAGLAYSNANGLLVAGSSGQVVMYLNRQGTDGDIAVFRKNGSTVGSIGCFGNGFYISDQGCGLSFDVEGVNNILPCNGSGAFTDNVTDLGSSSARFDDIYATNGTIQTSDINEKQDIEALSDAEQRVAVAAKGLLCKYRWKDAVAEKGDAARIHFGIIAQDLQAAFEAEGLDAGRYGMFISSTWWEAEVEKTREVEQEDGTTITETYTATETYDEPTEGATERTRLGVRYPELLAFIIAAL